MSLPIAHVLQQLQQVAGDVSASSEVGIKRSELEALPKEELIECFIELSKSYAVNLQNVELFGKVFEQQRQQISDLQLQLAAAKR